MIKSNDEAFRVVEKLKLNNQISPRLPKKQL